MKRTRLIPVAILAALMITTLTKGQNINAAFSENAVKSLVAGIKSNNEGLRRSSIYLAGKYRVTDAVDALLDRMTEDKNPNTRILIALSLYQIGDLKGLEAVKRQSITDNNERVKKMSALIFNEFQKNFTGNYVSLGY